MKKKTSKVGFKFDIDKDIENWRGACNSSFMGVDWKLKAPKNTLKHIVAKPKKEARQFLKKYLEKRYKKNSKYVIKFEKEIKHYWQEREYEIIKRIQKITKKPFWPQKITCYYGTFARGNYRINENDAWMILDPKVWYTKEIFCVSILHEILHFQFHKYFWKYLESLEVSRKQIDHIKEATTFLINEEFQDLIPFKDWGYPIHKEFRQDLMHIWRNDKNFRRLLNESVKLIKGKYSSLPK